MRRLAYYSDRLEKAPKMLRSMIERDERIVAYTIEPDGCFIYTVSAEWCDDDGSGTFRGDTVTEAIRKYKKLVRKAGE